MDAVADSIVVTSEDACPRDSSMRKSDRPRKLTAKGMENLSGNVGIVMQALIREVREETMKQMAKAQQETVKEITTSHERIIETLWNAWKKEQQALKQMIEGQEKVIRQLQQDIQGIQAQAAQERKLMQEQIDELKRMQQHAPRDIEPLQVQASEEIKRIHEKLDIMAQHAVADSARTNPRQSFADIARMLPTEGRNGGVRGPDVVSSPTPPLSSPGEDLFCTIDISGVGDDDRNKAQIGEVRQAIEAAVRTKKEGERWRCAAVVRGARNANIVKYDSDKEAAADVDTGDNVTETSSMRQVLIATSASARNGLVGMGGVVRNTAGGGVNDDVIAKYSVTLGLRDEQNAYMAELEAIAMVLRCMPHGLRHREVIMATRNRSALQAIAKPRQQSGQGTIREIYKHVERLEKGGNTIEMRWVSSTDESFTLGAKAKAEARKATDSGCR
ncbi:hypothetical protein FOFC_08143, partial [Fusarium oxysporum]